jgi:uncharacterized protein YkwD
MVSCQDDLVLEDGLLYQEQTQSEPWTDTFENMEEMEAELLDMINEHRSSQGLSVLNYDETTYLFARQHNEYMIVDGKLSHENFSSRARQLTEQTGATEVAENVARNYTNSKDVLNGWIASSGHRRNIEGNYNYTGLSIKADDEGNLYFTQIFVKK